MGKNSHPLLSTTYTLRFTPKKDTPHPVLEVALGLLRLVHQDPAKRTVLNDIARLYHEGSPGAPKGIVPLVSVYQLMRQRGVRTSSVSDFIGFGGLLHVLGLWRLAKGAYLYDPDLAREVAATPLTRLPTELLFRLPEPAPLILLPEGLPSWPEILGFHPLLDWDPGSSTYPPHFEARFLLYTLKEHLILPLDLDAEDLMEAVEKTLSRSWVSSVSDEDRLAKVYGSILREALSLTLYLCQEAPDLGGLSPRPPAPLVRVKGEKKVFPPDTPLVLPTGWRWGKAIRLAREQKKALPSSPTGRRVIPHIRRAHWHLYWTGTGSKKDPTKARPVLKWIPATFVNRDLLLEAGLTEDDLPAVARKVEAHEDGDL